MPASQRHLKLIAMLTIAAALLFSWMWMSLVRITNDSKVSLSYTINGTAKFDDQGVLAPGESKYIPRLLTNEGGIHIQTGSANGDMCEVNVYVVPPVGGKCNVRLTHDAIKCRCRLGL